MHSLRKYVAFLKIHFLARLQYRSAALSGIVTQVFWGMMYILLYNASYASRPEMAPMTVDQTSSYIWIQQAFLIFFNLWTFDNKVFQDIRSGDIAYDLVRPLNVYGVWFIKNIALRLGHVVLRSIPILILGAFLPPPFHLILPQNLLQTIGFVVVLSGGFVLTVSMMMLIYISAFYVTEVRGVLMFSFHIYALFAGQIVPLPFFPDAFRKIAELLPFGATADLVGRVYNGHINAVELLQRIGIQLFWIIVLIWLGVRLTNRAMKRVEVLGG